MNNLNTTQHKSNKTVECAETMKISIFMVSTLLIAAFASCSQPDQTADPRVTESTSIDETLTRTGKLRNSHRDIVSLGTFSVDKHEVTNKKFEIFMTATGHPAPAYWDDPRLNKSEQPVVGINWFDAKTYCEWEGKRLPTEYEWEQVSRGPNKKMLPEENKRNLSEEIHPQRNTEIAATYSEELGTASVSLYHTSYITAEWLEHWSELYDQQKFNGTMDKNVRLNHTWSSDRADYLDLDSHHHAMRTIDRHSRRSARSNQHAVIRSGYPKIYSTYALDLGFRCAKSISADHQKSGPHQSLQSKDRKRKRLATEIMMNQHTSLFIDSLTIKNANRPSTQS